jgi:hypothetical protein
MGFRKKRRRRKTYAEKVLASTGTDKPKFVAAIDAFNVRSRARKAKILTETRNVAKAEEKDYKQLEKLAERTSGNENALGTVSTDWDHVINVIRDAPAGIDKAEALQDFERSDPRRKWKGPKPKKVEKGYWPVSISPMLKRVSEVKG